MSDSKDAGVEAMLAAQSAPRTRFATNEGRRVEILAALVEHDLIRRDNYAERHGKTKRKS